MYLCVAAVAVQVQLPTACPVAIVLLLFVTHGGEGTDLTGTLCCAAAQWRYSKQGNMARCS